MNKTALFSALGIAAITLGAAVPATAVMQGYKPPKPVLTIDGSGTYSVDDEGNAVVTGEIGGDTLTGDFVAVLTPIDGTLPDPETCEPAMATITVSNSPRPDLVLAGVGDVCGFYPQPPTSIVTHVFTGRYRVLDAKKVKVRNTDGFFEIRMGTGNVASAFAIDT